METAVRRQPAVRHRAWCVPPFAHHLDVYADAGNGAPMIASTSANVSRTVSPGRAARKSASG